MRPAAVHDSPGDPAFEQVYRSSYSTLVGQLFLLTTNRAEAEDVVQEAFARLWGNWRELRGYDNHEAWGAASRHEPRDQNCAQRGNAAQPSHHDHGLMP